MLLSAVSVFLQTEQEKQKPVGSYIRGLLIFLVDHLLCVIGNATAFLTISDIFKQFNWGSQMWTLYLNMICTFIICHMVTWPHRYHQTMVKTERGTAVMFSSELTMHLCRSDKLFSSCPILLIYRKKAFCVFENRHVLFQHTLYVHTFCYVWECAEKVQCEMPRPLNGEMYT